ncbi:alpha-glucosidase C-terminal domain-containing protein [bacterium]|nr:alpha-glucosidase C-terminal domain-containing protein [bacterium]
MPKKNLFYSALTFLLFTNLILKAQNFPENSQILGLATPVNLQNGETEIRLGDYFSSKVDSIAFQNFFSAEILENKLLLKPLKTELPKLIELKVWSKGFAYSLLLKKSRKIQQKITFSTNKTYSKVQLAGDFNGWNPNSTELQKTKNDWETTLLLEQGKYPYQFVVDGKWILDPTNPDSVDNNLGGFNSVLKVGKTNRELLPQLFTESFKKGKLIEQTQTSQKERRRGFDPIKPEKAEITIGTKNEVDELFVFWQNFRIPFRKTGKNKILIELPTEAFNLERSFLRVWAFNKEGVSNDLLIPLCVEKNETENLIKTTLSVVENPSQLNQNDTEATILYFAIVDRFFNGNLANDQKVLDKDVHEKANYFGGDLAGITQKIEEGYFKLLGVNTLWISPIAQNPENAYVEFPEPHRKFSGYHGYWPISSSKIDHRFGTENEFKNLVNEAHKQKMNVLLDYVSNHVHENHPAYQNHKDWATQLDLADGRKNIRIWDEHRLTTWFDTFLPSLDYSKPEVVKSMTDSALFWIKTYQLDGFRHDATKHVPNKFWQTLTEKIKNEIAIPQNKRIFQIGETFGSRELIGSYVNSGELDSQFDFNLYFDARSVFAIDSESFTKVKNSIFDSFDFYGNHSLMGNITGNHDMPRFIAFAGEDLSFNENANEVGWEREVKIKNPVAYKKLQSLTAFILTIPGVPVIFYGDEIGMVGAGDPDNRKPMKFSDLTKNELITKASLQKLTHLRSRNLSLIYGDFEVLECSDKTFAFARTYFDEISIVVFNKDLVVRNFELKLPERFKDAKLINNFGERTMQRDGTLLLEILPNSFEVLTKN